MEDRNNDPAESREDAARRVKDAASDAAQRVRDAAGSVVTDVKHAAMQGVEDARAKAGDTGHTTASRLRDLAGQVEGDLPWMATAFSRSAEGLDSVTDSLTRGDLNQTLSGLSDFARRQPAIFLGASVALGFALARVGKTAFTHADTDAKPTTNGTAEQPFESASTAYPNPTGV